MTSSIGFLIRISAQHVAKFKLIMMRKMVEWLREHDSEECAEWWEKYWTSFRDPRRGAITLAVPTSKSDADPSAAEQLRRKPGL
jgi:hypothetical protein